jgi:hypothetical protein
MRGSQPPTAVGGRAAGSEISSGTIDRPRVFLPQGSGCVSVRAEQVGSQDTDAKRERHLGQSASRCGATPRRRRMRSQSIGCPEQHRVSARLDPPRTASRMATSASSMTRCSSCRRRGVGTTAASDVRPQRLSRTYSPRLLVSVEHRSSVCCVGLIRRPRIPRHGVLRRGLSLRAAFLAVEPTWTGGVPVPAVGCGPATCRPYAGSRARRWRPPPRY